MITKHLDLWSSTVRTKSSAGRGGGKKRELYGIKKLRELILELAVRGLLVPQDPNDEPAEVLLEKIAEEKQRLIEEGKIKKQKKLPPIAEEDSFKIPNTWELIPLDTIAEINGGFAFKSTNYTESGIRVIRISDFDENGFKNTTIVRHSPSKDLNNFHLKKHNILMAMTGGTVGKSLFVINLPEPMAVNQRVATIRVSELTMSRHAYFVMQSKVVQSVIANAKNSTNDNISMTHIRSFRIPLPPLAEQHRIVAKVDELMALCDALEARQEDSLDTHETLVKTLLDTLTTAADPATFQQAWQRIQSHFHLLFTTESSIDHLKQTILQLAVMGKLVEQDPNEEPASELLKKIAAEKQRLIAEKKIKKQKELAPITEEEKPFELPEGWVWVRFGDLVNYKSKLVHPNDYENHDQVAPDSIEKGTGHLLFRRTVSESGIRGPNNLFYKGQILYSKIRPSLSKVIIAEFDGLCSADIYPIDSMISPNYLLKIMLSEVFLIQVRKAENRIKMPKLNIISLSNIIVPLAPQKNHSSITNITDELMTLSDTLKAQLHSAQETQQTLCDTLTSLEN